MKKPNTRSNHSHFGNKNPVDSRFWSFILLLSALCWPAPYASFQNFARLRGIPVEDVAAPFFLAKRSASSGTLNAIVPGWETPYYAQGPAGNVYALTVSGDQVVAGGSFFGADTVKANNIVLWNGSRWSKLGTGLRPKGSESASIFDLAPDGKGGFYAAGYFDSAGATACRGVAQWTGSEWRCLDFRPPPLEWPATALSMVGNTLYAGSETGIYQWNGNTWNRLDPGISGTVSRLRTIAGELWAGGEFSVAGDTSIRNLARKTAAGWSGFGTQVGPIRDFTTLGVDAFAIETRQTLSRIDTQTVVRWNGTAWSRVDQDLPKCEFSRVMTDAQEVYLVGTGLADSRLHIFKWDGSRFQPFLTENGFGFAAALVVSGNRIFLGGRFNGVAGVRADNVCVWNGSAWKGLTIGTGPGPVSSGEVMASNGKALFLGGRFIRWTDKQPVSGIARFDGSAWDGMAGGFKDKLSTSGNIGMTVRALAFDGNDIFAGGSFDSSQTGPAHNIARWNGSAWSAMGDGYPGLVNDLAIQDHQILLAGKPDSGNAGGTAAVRGQAVCRWNGSAWEKIGDGLIGEAYKSAVFRGELFVGGKVRALLSDTLSGILRFTGNQWSRLPVLTPAADLDSVSGFAILHDELYVLGHTRKAGPYDQSLWKWDGKGLSWVSSIYHATGLVADDNFLYISMWSSMQSTAALQGSTLARWNSSSGWQSLTDEMKSFEYVNQGKITSMDGSIAVHGDYLYASARFSGFDGKPAFWMVRWKRTGVNALSPKVSRNGHAGRIAYLRFGDLAPWEIGADLNVGGPLIFDIQGRRSTMGGSRLPSEGSGNLNAANSSMKVIKIP